MFQVFVQVSRFLEDSAAVNVLFLGSGLGRRWSLDGSQVLPRLSIEISAQTPNHLRIPRSRNLIQSC